MLEKKNYFLEVSNNNEEKVKYSDIFIEKNEKESEFNKELVLNLFSEGEKRGQDITILTQNMIDTIWENYYSKFRKQQKSTKFLRKFNKTKNSEIYNIIEHLHKIIGIKNIDIIGKLLPYDYSPKYNESLISTQNFLNVLESKDDIKNIMVDSHFNSLLTKEKRKKSIKIINSVKANRNYKKSAFHIRDKEKENKNEDTLEIKKNINPNLSYYQINSFFPVLEVYLTKIKILKIHKDIKPLLSALNEFKYKNKDTPYSSGLKDEKLERHFAFSNIFPERDTNLYIVLIFAIYLKVSFEESRKFIALLLGYEIRGNFATLSSLKGRYNDIKELELMLEYLDK